MICAAVIRNFGDFTKAYKINDAALDAVSNVALSLFVTMAINSLKLVQLIDLALPLITILVAQMALICVFAYLIYFIFGRNYDAVMLGAGAIGFGLGATPNALVNMLSLAGKHGPSPRAWLVVSFSRCILNRLCKCLPHYNNGWHSLLIQKDPLGSFKIISIIRAY